MPADWLSELDGFLRIPSVSADPAHAADVRRAAEWVCERVRSAGGEASVVPYGDGELAVGDLAASHGGTAPTLLVYGHYDVQPPAPLELWETEPFEPVVRDGWLHARGVTDDKGQLFMLLKAAQLLALEGALPVNLRFVCDGEEECGGDTVVRFLREQPSEVDAAVIFDGWSKRPDVPELVIGTRGIVSVKVQARTGGRDLHSGHYGGAALNAIHALVEAIAALLPRDGRLPEPLRAGVTEPTAEEVASWERLPCGADELARVEAVPLDARAEEEFYARVFAEPSIDVNGILGGKPGLVNTTVVSNAQAQLTIRIVPGQDVEKVGRAAEELLRAGAPPGTTLDVVWDGVPAALLPADSEALRLALDAFERVWARPVVVRAGGTLPVLAALGERQLPTVMMGFGSPDSNTHSPNERLPLETIDRGIAVARELFTALARLTC